MELVAVNMGSLSQELLERRFRIIGEGHGDGVNEPALCTTIACSRAVRAQLDLLQRKGP